MEIRVDPQQETQTTIECRNIRVGLYRHVIHPRELKKKFPRRVHGQFLEEQPTV